MPTDVIDRVRQLNQDVLAPVVRGVLNDDSAYPTSGWKVEPIGRSIGIGTLGIFRVAGDSTTNSGHALWSVVAKVMDTDATSNLFQNSPVREIQAYESGLLGSIGSISAVDIGLRAAEHYGVVEISGLGSILWVEDLSEAEPPPWDDDTYLAIARVIGRFNANWELNPPERQPWFLDDQHSDKLEKRLKQFTSVHDYLDNALVQRVTIPEVVENMGKLAKALPSVIALSNTGPRPLSHLDAQPRNLFPMPLEKGAIEIVAIDWASIGYAPLGSDASALVGSTMTWCEIDAEHGAKLHTRALSSYLAGLEDMGWQGDTGLVRLVYMTGAVQRAAFNAMFPALWIDEPDWKGRTVGMMHKSPEVLIDHYRDVFTAVFPLFEKELTSAEL